MSELDPNAESALPTAVTPAMLEALRRFQTGGGGLGTAIGDIITSPVRDIVHGLTTVEPSETEQGNSIGAALGSALGLVGPMGAGKGMGLAMATMGGAAKKAGKPLAELAAESFRGSLPKSLPPDHTETILSAIKDALGGDWDHASNLPKAGSQWQQIPATAEHFNKPFESLQPHIDKLLADAPKPSLADAGIDAKLAANPGMSIFDLAGLKNPTHVVEPHMAIDTESLPRTAAWQMPEKAKEQGYNVAAHHGTRVPTIFDEFKLPDDEIGVHFGSPRAAQEIQGSTLDWSTAPRVYPAAIVAQNPLRMDDLGSWSPVKIARHMESKLGFDVNEVKSALYKDTGITPKENTMYVDPMKTNAPGVTEKMTQNMRDYISSKGHDSIVYKNKVEDKGHDSYILFRESPSKPGHIYGARLPWADFDPSKFTSANIKAGIPLAGAAGAYAASQDGSLRPVKDVEHNPFEEPAQ